MPVNRDYPLDEHSTLNVNATDEGVIFDLIVDDEVTATAGMMADEWATYLFPPSAPPAGDDEA